MEAEESLTRLQSQQSAKGGPSPPLNGGAVPSTPSTTGGEASPAALGEMVAGAGLASGAQPNRMVEAAEISPPSLLQVPEGHG